MSITRYRLTGTKMWRNVLKMVTDHRQFSALVLLDPLRPSRGLCKMRGKSRDSKKSGMSLPRSSIRQRKPPGDCWNVAAAFLTSSSDMSLFHNKATKGGKKES